MNVEHRTSNVQRRIKKPGKRRLRCRALNDYFLFFSAVLMLATKIIINSSVSSKISSNSFGLCKLCSFIFSHSKFDVGVFAYLDVRCSMFISYCSFQCIQSSCIVHPRLKTGSSTCIFHPVPNTQYPVPNTKYPIPSSVTPSLRALAPSPSFYTSL